MDFEEEDDREEDSNLERETSSGENEKEHSPIACMSVFYCLGMKLTDHDLSHMLDIRPAHRGRSEGSESRAPPSRHQKHLFPQQRMKDQAPTIMRRPLETKVRLTVMKIRLRSLTK